MGPPIDGAKEALETLRSQDNEIIIFTVMATTEGGTKAVEDWLVYYEVPFDEVTAIKPNADVFLDDKAIRFVDWQQALADMEKLW